MPSASATLAALPWLSPVTSTLLMPIWASRSMAARAVGLTVSPKAISASAVGASGARCISQETVLPAAFELFRALGELRAVTGCRVR